MNHRIEHTEPHFGPRRVLQRLDTGSQSLQHRVPNAVLMGGSRAVHHEHEQRSLRGPRAELLADLVFDGSAGELGALGAVKANAGAVGGAEIPGRRGVLRAAEIAEVVIAAVDEANERVHVAHALLAANQSRGSVEKRERVLAGMLFCEK